MAKESEKDIQPQAPHVEAASASMNIGLEALPGSEQPVLANVTVVRTTAGVAILDFGFLDPGVMSAVGRLAREGKKIPERMTGRLAARVALSYEGLVKLHRDIGAVLQALSKAQKPQ
jgi:hypothetical protein